MKVEGMHGQGKGGIDKCRKSSILKKSLKWKEVCMMGSIKTADLICSQAKWS